jgi:hypothetical protein
MPSLGSTVSARFLFVTGKGGVGKSTVAAALGLRYAREGKRVLLALCNTKERLSSLFGSEPLTSEITSLAPGLWAVNMEPQVALREYGLLALKSRTLTKVLFDNKYVQSFFRAVPGMQEWTLLGKAWWHTTELDESGKQKYDIVIVDAPATGHGLDMMRVPKVIVELVPPGLLRRDAERAWAMFQDPKQSGVVLVTLPEDMPTTETLELEHALRTELHLPIAHVVINGRLATKFSAKDAKNIAMGAASSDPSVCETATLAELRLGRELAQAACAARLASLSIPTSVLPHLVEGVSHVKQLEALSRELF